MNEKINNIITIILFFIVFISPLKAQKIGDKISPNILSSKLKIESYRLLFQKDFVFSSDGFLFLIFENDLDRKLILGKKNKSGKIEIICINNTIIYPLSNDCVKRSFKKIVKKDLFFTIEENYCTNTRGQYLKEYFTFKYIMEEKNFILYKYSFNLVNSLPADDGLPPKSFIEDEYPTETFTQKDFGIITIKEFEFDKIKIIRNKYLESR